MHGENTQQGLLSSFYAPVQHIRAHWRHVSIGSRRSRQSHASSQACEANKAAALQASLSLPS